jgi:molybdenum cofactor cytidylyltransferase
MIVAVIPAAGKSTRMGRPKLALPLGGRTVLERVLDALRAGGVEQTLVVLGPHVADLAPLARSAGAHVLLLDHETPDMRTTVEEGLRWLEDRLQPKPDDDWLLVPADHPALVPAVIAQLRETRARHPQHSILIPTWQGRRGHPTLIAWRHVAGVRAHPPGQGLNTYLRRHADETLEVPVEYAEVLEDLDTPEDFERMRRRFAGDEPK